jgi:hypothetical protein
MPTPYIYRIVAEVAQVLFEMWLIRVGMVQWAASSLRCGGGGLKAVETEARHQVTIRE